MKMDKYSRFDNINFILHECGEGITKSLIKELLDKSKSVETDKNKVVVLILTDGINEKIIDDIELKSYKDNGIDIKLYDFSNGKYNAKVIKNIIDVHNKDSKVTGVGIDSIRCFKLTSNEYSINYRDDVLDELNKISKDYKIPIIVGRQVPKK